MQKNNRIGQQNYAILSSDTEPNKTEKKLAASVAIIILLCICLAVTTFALVFSMVSVEDNLFKTGTVKINLNDGKPVIDEHEFIFEPGMTVKKNFFVKNESSCNVYYKLYFRNISGGLADVLQVKICNDDKVLFEGAAKEFTKENVSVADDVIRHNEIRELQIYFHFPEESGNNAQNLYLNFDMVADAVQTKNNPNKEF